MCYYLAALLLTANDDHSILQKVKLGENSLNGPEWNMRSKEAKDLIVNRMKYNPNERISASQALQHSWFTRFLKNNKDNESTKRNNEISFNNLRRFNVKQNILRATIAFLVHNFSSS